MSELFFMTWDEVKEGQEVWVFSRTNKLDGLLYKKIEGGLYYQTEEETWARSDKNYLAYKFLPVPKDRPEPNLWDEHVDKHGDFDLFRLKPFNDGKMHKGLVKKYATYFRALAAWINHILDGET